MDSNGEYRFGPVISASEEIREGSGRVVVFTDENGREISVEVSETDFINLIRYGQDHNR